MEGKAVHVFTEVTAILDYVPAGWETEEEGEPPARKEDELDDQDLPALDEAEEERLKNDESLKWDEDEDEEEDAEDKDEKDKDSESEDEEEDKDKDDKESSEESARPRRRNGRAPE
jgi:Ran GTPase-activating protein (RanGAP) involved in mRNA processing and transport